MTPKLDRGNVVVGGRIDILPLLQWVTDHLDTVTVAFGGDWSDDSDTLNVL